jgi:hypothetical protein
VTADGERHRGQLGVRDVGHEKQHRCTQNSQSDFSEIPTDER